jgi:hypothetical protein
MSSVKLAPFRGTLRTSYDKKRTFEHLISAPSGVEAFQLEEGPFRAGIEV